MKLHGEGCLPACDFCIHEIKEAVDKAFGN